MGWFGSAAGAASAANHRGGIECIATDVARWEARFGSPELKEFIRTLTERAERLKKERVDPAVDNTLKITGEGRKAALDMRLVWPGSEPQQETKVDRAVSQILKIWNNTRNERSTSPSSATSQPDPVRFNVYSDIRSKLVSAGAVPP